MIGRVGRAPLAAAALALFVIALALSWTQGARHLDLQALAMVLALLALLLAAVVARGSQGRQRS
ncbi:MAG: hypothetical protein ACREOD_03210 [Candidatus Dormibacteria bacterium]